MRQYSRDRLVAYVSTVAIIFCLTTTISAACDQDAICEHVTYCLYKANIDGNLRFNIIHDIKSQDSASIRSDVYKCQNLYGSNDGYGHWKDDEKLCDDNALLAMAKEAYAKKCTAKPAPPSPPPPSPAQPTTPNHAQTCVTPHSSCPTTIGPGGSCWCEGDAGVSQ